TGVATRPARRAMRRIQRIDEAAMTDSHVPRSNLRTGNRKGKPWTIRTTRTTPTKVLRPRHFPQSTFSKLLEGRLNKRSERTGHSASISACCDSLVASELATCGELVGRGNSTEVARDLGLVPGG